MAQVTVTIDGRKLRIGCEDGEERRLEELAQDFDERIVKLRVQFGEVGDHRLAIMAALTVADDLFEARRQLEASKRELDDLRKAQSITAEGMRTSDAALATAVMLAAERIENLTRKLNQNDSYVIPGNG